MGKINTFEFIRRLGMLGYIKINVEEEKIKQAWTGYLKEKGVM